MSSFLVIPKVIRKYADVFVMPCYCYDLMNWQIDLYMAEFSEREKYHTNKGHNKEVQDNDVWLVIYTCFIRL